MPAVTISAFKAAVTKGPLAPVYLFHGSDDFLKEDWVRRLTEAATDPGLATSISNSSAVLSAMPRSWGARSMRSRCSRTGGS